MPNKRLAPPNILLCSALFAAAFATGAWADGSVGEPGRGSGEPNPLKNVYFGEEHMHTRNSFDAFTIGVNQTWDQAYEYATGIVISPILQLGADSRDELPAGAYSS
jgi:hypothetical protein